MYQAERSIPFRRCDNRQSAALRRQPAKCQPFLRFDPRELRTKALRIEACRGADRFEIRVTFEEKLLGGAAYSHFIRLPLHNCLNEHRGPKPPFGFNAIFVLLFRLMFIRLFNVRFGGCDCLCQFHFLDPPHDRLYYRPPSHTQMQIHAQTASEREMNA